MKKFIEDLILTIVIAMGSTTTFVASQENFYFSQEDWPIWAGIAIALIIYSVLSFKAQLKKVVKPFIGITIIYVVISFLTLMFFCMLKYISIKLNSPDQWWELFAAMILAIIAEQMLYTKLLS